MEGSTGRALTQAAADPTAVTTLTATLEAELTSLFVLICTLFVFQMQSGFALLEAGSVRVKNTKNILMKNAIDACVSSLCWWSVGHAFAYGTCGQNGFIGGFDFFSSEASAQGGTYWALWLWNWAFSATAATIVSGAVAERLQFKAYLIYTTVISGFIYPVVVHWVWSNSGWLSAKRQACGQVGYDPYISGTMGVMDFAGSGVVHMVGGAAALMAAIIVGPRLGRYDKDAKPDEFLPSNPVYQALGVFILWLGWYAFNSGSVNCFENCMVVAAQIAVNTTLAVSFSGLTCLFLAILMGLPGDIGPVLNGVLAGAVSITAGCALVQSYGASLIGIIGGLIYTGSSRLLRRLKVDDPVDAAAVHFCCGAWGVIAVGFFATETSVAAAYTYADNWGVFYGGSAKQLGVQVLGVVVMAAWACSLSAILFLVMKKMCWLRVPEHVERQGLDLAQSLGTGVMGKCFQKSAYTMAVESHLARPSARPSASQIEVHEKMDGNGAY